MNNQENHIEGKELNQMKNWTKWAMLTLLVGFCARQGKGDGAAPETTSKVATGVWMESFAAATNLAYTTKTPLVLFWGNELCPECAKLEAAFVTDTFKNWQADHDYFVYCYVIGSSGNDTGVNKGSGAKDFACTAAGTISSRDRLKQYPFVCLWWPKDDGDVVVSSFVGRTGQMGVSQSAQMNEQQLANRDPEMLKLLADEFERAVEKAFGDYATMPEYVGGDLAFTGEYANARLEAEAGFTSWVDIPLERDAAAAPFATTNTLTTTVGGTELMREDVQWSEGETSKFVRVMLPTDAAVGSEIAVALFDDKGGARGRVKVFVVGERENSTKNPLFIGERTADTLDYGEWTMDLDVAMAKYKKEPDAHLLAIASGSLWCPDCVMTDGHVLETNEFKKWAIDNKVILVDIDVPNFPNTTNSACLLTRVVGRTSDGYISGRGTLATNELERYQSGAGYLSRHMVSAADAAKVLERNRSLVGRNTLNGGWNNPDRANQNRTGIPNFFALDRNGALVGTFETFDTIGPFEFKEAYLNRFSELIALEDSASGDFSDRCWQTTKATYAGVDKASGATLSALDLVDVYKLSATTEAASAQTVAVQGSDTNATVTISLIEVVGGTARTIATATGRLADGVSATGVISSTGGSYYVSISGKDSGTLAADSSAANTVTAYTLSGSRRPIDNPFLNEWTAKKTAATLPLYTSGGQTLKGILALSLKKNGKISAKYSAGGGNIATFSGKWNVDIAADGTATARLEKKGLFLSIVMRSDGTVAAEVDDGACTLTSGECGLAENYGEFAGSYTVAFPSFDGSATIEPSGDAVMTLKMAATPSAKTNGQFKYTVYLPNGKRLTGSSSVTWTDANFGIVPVLRTVGVETFAAVLKVRRSAGVAPSPRAIIAQDGVPAVWTNKTKGQSFARTFAVRGSWYDKNDSLLVGIADDMLALEFTSATESTVPSPVWGALTGVAGDGTIVTVTDTMMSAARTTGFSLKLNRTTGVFTGKSTLSFEGKARVAATFTGVLIPGWFSDCDCGEDSDDLIEMGNVAFGLGYCLFADRVNGKSAKRSFLVEIR